jgi:hypothetical protein
MKERRPLSVYFTPDERQKLAKIAEHCKRPESDQVRWLVESTYMELFGRRPSSKQKSR